MNRIFLLLTTLLLFTGCPSDTGDDDSVLASFDRGALLTEYAGMYTSRYQGFAEDAEAFWRLVDETTNRPLSQEEVGQLVSPFFALYLNWQRVGTVVTTVGEEVFLSQRINTYPTDAAGLLASIGEETNYELPANFDIQGLPAIEYLILFDNGSLLVGDGPEVRERKRHLSRLVEMVVRLTRDRYEVWNGSFAASFIENDGNSVTASLDRMVNDLIFNYERYTRAGKVGIPAGVFSNLPLPDRVEGIYTGFSRALLRQSVTTTRVFLLGLSDSEYHLGDYLDALDVVRDGELLSVRITRAFDEILSAIDGLDPDLAMQVASDNGKMLETYDAMQRLLVLLKVDMVQALNINIDYVDADGD